MTNSLKNLQGFAASLVVLLVLIVVAYFIAPVIKSQDESLLDTTPAAVQPRVLTAVIGMALAFGVAYVTADSLEWAVGSRQIVLMVVGTFVYGVLAWLFNGQTFILPALSLVTLQPALVVPVFFGFMFGPVVGFMTGAAGYIVSELFMGLVSPHWAVAHGIVGLVAGMAMLMSDEKQSLDVATAIAGAGGLIAAAFYFASPATQLSFFMGLSVLVGAGLAIALRFAFPNRQQWALGTLWGSAGIIVGLGLAAVADIWLTSATLAETIEGEFIPVAGPGLIALAILLPIVMIVYDLVQE